MIFHSLNNFKNKVTFKEALFQGIAIDQGLFVPVALPRLPQYFLEALPHFSLIEIADTIAKYFIDDIPVLDLKKIVQATFHFKIPLTPLNKKLFLLELFHGPTLAFKDIGARFMAECLSYFLKQDNKHIRILVATSGDTGSAVAHGFYNSPNIEVYILYPSGKVSPLQEKQMTTLGGNIHAIEIKGTFDDCQQLVKSALADQDIQKTYHVTTANSINLARLLPQVIYYFFGIAQLQKMGNRAQPTVVVPSGNFGNLTAAAYAKTMGAPIKHLVASTNQNNSVPEYLSTRIYNPRSSIPTFSNAMDVGNPNNFPRLKALWGEHIFEELTGISVTDAETLTEIRDMYHESHIILDPHTAVGTVAAKKLAALDSPMIVISTAHPGKFPEVIQQALGFEIPIPAALQKALHANKQSILMDNDFQTWKKFLLSSK